MFRLITRLLGGSAAAPTLPADATTPAPVIFQATAGAPVPAGPQRGVIYGSPRPAPLTDDEETQDRRLAQFDVVLADMMHAPSIEAVDLSEYGGEPGQLIRITARDDFAVARVTVRIENADGSLVEAGEATQQTNPLVWHYLTTAPNASLAGDKISIEVLDRPGNRDERQLSL